MNDNQHLYDLAAMGFRLIPLKERGKIPLIHKWTDAASADLAKIVGWATKYPNCNWGLVTGGNSGVFIIDLDVKADGDKTWDAITKDKKLPKTVEVKTGGGGTHIYYKYPKSVEVRNSASKIGDGIDVRGEGGQVVIPPSIHPNGTLYEWVDGPPTKEEDIASAPKWLLTLISKTEADSPDVPKVGEPMTKGSRNDNIYTQSLMHARMGVLEEVAVRTMISWCEIAGELDIPKQEIKDTVGSAYKYVAESKHKADITTIEFTDRGNAIRMLSLNNYDLKYVTAIGWHIWDGKAWAPDMEELKMHRFAGQAAISLESELKELLKITTSRAKQDEIFRQIQWAVGARNVAKVKSAVEAAKFEPGSSALHEEMDDFRSTYILNCTNGMLDLRTQVLMPHDKDYRITKMAPTAFNPDAECPMFLKTLNYAFDGDVHMIEYFQRALGYSLSGSIDEQCFFICYGPAGANGKSTILEAVHMVMGEGVYAKTSSASAITTSNNFGGGNAQSSLAALRKIRFVSVNEFAKSAVLDVELLKRLTGGDSLEARFLYKEVFTYQPSFKIWIRANNEPTVQDVGEAFWRRLKKIPFNFQIPKRERLGSTTMRAILEKEAEGILAWMVEGFKDWHENGGLRDPQEVKDAIKDYRNDSDLISQFLDENVEDSEIGFVSRKILYQVFQNWCKDQGIRYPMTNKAFSNRVASRLGQHKSVKKSGVRVWLGIQLDVETDDIMGGMVS